MSLCLVRRRMESAGLMFTAQQFNAICRSIEMQKGKTVFKLWSESHRARRNIPKADMEGRTRCATRSQQRHPGGSVSSQRRIFSHFPFKPQRARTPLLLGGGAGAVRITSTPRSFIRKYGPLLCNQSSRKAVRPACWLAVGDGMGAGSTAACRVGLLCRALAGTGGQRPVNSMLHHDGMHASQIPRVQGRGTASLNTSRLRMLACSASSTCNESRGLGPRRLRAQT